MSWLLFLCVVASAGSAPAQQWQLLQAPAAMDIGVGASGVVWFVGTDQSIYRMTNSGPQKVTGGGTRIAVDPTGNNPWIVNAGGLIFRWTGTAWQQMPGSAATDVGIGANGTVWVAGAGQALFRWNPSTNAWVQGTGGGVRVAVDPAGNPWVVNASKQVWRSTGTAWQQLPGTAIDVGVGPEGSAWMTGADTAGTPYRWSGSAWVKKSGGAAQISVDQYGNAWAVNSGGQIYSSWELSFPRGQTYEAQMLKAIGYGFYGTLNSPAYATLPPLDQKFGSLGLTAAERYFAQSSFAGQKITPDAALGKIANWNDATVRNGVIGILGGLVVDTVSKPIPTSDAPGRALRDWSTLLYRNAKILSVKALVDEYARWKVDYCTYEFGRSESGVSQCRALSQAATLSGAYRSPPYDLMARNALGTELGPYADNTAQLVALGIGTATAVGLTAGAGVALLSVLTPITTTAGVAAGTTLFGAFSGIATIGGIGATGWAGVVAAPVAGIVFAAVGSTVQGLKVFEGEAYPWKIREQLRQAMEQTIVIENDLTNLPEAARLFYIAFAGASLGAYSGGAPVGAGFSVKPVTVPGEVRFYCQAGYVSRFKLNYYSGGQKSFATSDLPVGREESFQIPVGATSIVASGEFLGGDAKWYPLFNRTIPQPTYVGFTSYGTVFSPQVKDIYPEIAGIIAPPNRLILTHGGGYVARFTVTYLKGGQTVNGLNSGNTTFGWHNELEIPPDATNIRLYAEEDTGWVGEPVKKIIDKTYPSPPSECIKVFGTTLDPKWGNACSN